MSIMSPSTHGNRGGQRVLTMSRLMIDYKQLYDKVEGFLSIDGFGEVLHACHFVPYAFSKSTLVTFRRAWMDNLGNTFTVGADFAGKHRFVENDFSVDRSIMSNFDCYAGIGIEKHISIGKVFYLSIGKDIDTQQPLATMLIRGIDDRLRAFTYTDQWHAISPLVFNIFFVKSVFNLNPKEKVDLPAVTYSDCYDLQFITSFSPKDIFAMLKKFI